MGFRTASAFLFFAMVSGCAGIKTFDTSHVETVNIADLSADPAKYGFADGPPKKELIIKVDKGQAVPLYFKVDGPIIKLEVDQNKISFNRDVYIYISKSKLLLGPDGKRWTGFANGKAIKELFNLRRTSIGFGLHASQKQGVIITFTVDQHREE